jgi:peptidoglycan/LPS O-acetylase OafA/YrhL
VLSNVQALRFIAAYAVVVHHIIDSLNNYIARMGIDNHVGARGVDVFFVISDFIMAYSTNGRDVNWKSFAINRLTRIVPLYWLLTSLSFLLIVSGFELFGRDSAYPSYLLSSLMFISTDPILFVGWTLNLEMMFYAIFSLSLVLFSGKRCLFFVSLSIFVVFFIGLFAPEDSAYAFFSQFIILEFAGGVLIYLILSRWMPSVYNGLGFLLFGLVLLVLSGLPGSSELTVAIQRVAGSFFIVLGVVAADYRGLSMSSKIAKLQGDASYSTYLIHPFVIQILGKFSIVTGLYQYDIGLILTVLMMFFASGLAGTMLHLFVEAPMLRHIRSMLGKGSSARRTVSG